jgi:TatA/E family protein of Tat protein translocase
MSILALFGGLQMGELIILGLLGLLIFGKRLPEVGKNLGKGIVEFKKGLSGVQEDIEKGAAAPPRMDQPRIAAPLDSVSAEDQLRAENERLRAQIAQKSQH